MHPGAMVLFPCPQPGKLHTGRANREGLPRIFCTIIPTIAGVRGGQPEAEMPISQCPMRGLSHRGASELRGWPDSKAIFVVGVTHCTHGHSLPGTWQHLAIVLVLGPVTRQHA